VTFLKTDPVQTSASAFCNSMSITEQLGSCAASSSANLSILLFGWVGSNTKLLSKYADVFSKSPLVKRILHTTAPTYDVFINTNGLVSLARSSLDQLLFHPNEPVIIMLMSNGGVLVYLEMLKLLQKEPRRYECIKIIGTIFDSSPAYLSFDSMSRAPTEGIRNPTFRNIAYWIFRLLILPLLFLFIFGFDAPDRFWKTLIEDSLPCPSLYIYSMHDLLTDSKRLDELVEARRERHLHKIFTFKIFDTEEKSPHVMHLLKHRERYEIAVFDFIKYTYT
jgi:hypothetical protein